jgi:hypothetical protein
MWYTGIISTLKKIFSQFKIEQYLKLRNFKSIKTFETIN